jgi:pimeloyl-ACP methyl ester carboxylesterase
MAFASVNGFRLYYEAAGGGDPVVLIAGLGADAHFWYKQVPALAGRFRVLTFDNRDSNRSDHVDAAYTVADMAGDVKRLLEALEIEAAHVVGASLGGFIAQELALAAPARVHRLVLCCTSFGGSTAEPIPEHTLAAMMSRTGDAERDLRALLPLQIATDYLETHATEIDDYVAWRVAHPQSLPAYQRQLAAAVAHDTADRLSALRMPVLILHGAHDRVVPARNAELLASHIPGARLRLFPDAGHLFLWEAAGEANRAIIEFLTSG